MIPFPPRGLYVLTTPTPAMGLVEAVRCAVEAGARAVQYRNKSGDARSRRTEAAALVELCHDLGVPLIVNDDVSLAREVGAAGVHLGRDDAALSVAREVLEPEAIIGVSCYDSRTRALQAYAGGADYVAFGSFFPSPTKPQAVRAGIELLQRTRAELDLPIVAIGGITPYNAKQLLAAGADVLAVISGVFGREDPSSAVREYAKLFHEPSLRV